LKALEQSEEARAQEAKEEDKRALQNLKSQKKADLQDETRLNEARFVMNFVKKAKADVMKMKIINPVAGAIEHAKREIEMAEIEHQKDVAHAGTAAHAAAVAATKFDAAAKIAVNGTMKPTAAGSALRMADIQFHQALALAHLSKMEVLDAQGDLRKHQRTFDDLQARMQDKQKKLVIAAEAKAKEEAPKIWTDKLKEMKEKVKAKNEQAAEKQAEQADKQTEEEQTKQQAQEEPPAEPETQADQEKEADQEKKAEAEEKARQDASTDAANQAVKQREAEADQTAAEERASQLKEKQEAKTLQKQQPLQPEKTNDSPQQIDQEASETGKGAESPESPESPPQPEQNSNESPAEQRVEAAKEQAKAAGVNLP